MIAEPKKQIPDWSNKILLIAEDMDSNYTVLTALLKSTKIQLIRSITGIDAVAKADQADLILMDISMPDMDGIEATEQIRQKYPNKIIIAQTAHEPSVQIPMTNFNEVLLKPIRKNILIDTLSKYLS